MKGILYLIASPIGNLGDITLRALDVLRDVDIIASEDTRRTKKLLSHYDIHTKLISYHDHSSEKERLRLIEELQNGTNIGLISDAGTPLVNDPGFKLVRHCVQEGIQVTALPGPSSVINALILSGIPTDRFCFLGYLPVKSGKRTKELERIHAQDMTTIVLESPYRIVKSLADMVTVLGDKPIAVCREMTKVFEEIFRGTSKEALDHFSQKTPKGEFTIVITGNDKKTSKEKEYE